MATSADFAERLGALRIAAGLSARQVAARAGVSHTTVSRALKPGAALQWSTFAAIIRACGGIPEDFREAWLNPEPVPPASVPEELYRLRCVLEALDSRAGQVLDRVTPDMLVPGLAQDRLRDYKLRGETAWDAAPGCPYPVCSARITGASDLIAWILHHERDYHS